MKPFNNGLGFPFSVTAHEIQSDVNATRHPCHDIIYAHLFPGNGKKGNENVLLLNGIVNMREIRSHEYECAFSAAEA